MQNLELIKQEKEQLLNSVIGEIEERNRTIVQLERERQNLESQGLVIQGAITMLDELIAKEEAMASDQDKAAE